MSLDAWEQDALNSIADDLAASAPELVSRLSVFNRLTRGERMPGSRGDVAHSADERTWPAIPVLTVMVLATVIMIAVALVLSGTSRQAGRTGQVGQCVTMWPIQCSGR